MSKVKICGLRRAQDIEAVNKAMPDYIGFVFAPGKRQVSTEAAAKLKKQLHPSIQAVGVFVNQEIPFITGLYQRGIIDLVQLHGEEDAAYITKLQAVCSAPVIKALGVADTVPAVPAGATYALFDTASAQRGGTGQAFNWQLLQGYTGSHYFLAGGLHSGNVAQAIQALHPYCVDVSSGVELDGWKDSEKISAFVRLVREN